ncbi:MAG: hypothetical protein ACRDF4_06775 [Rhabdochlamydiaceae bacterium]
MNRRIYLTPEMEVILRRYITEYKLPLEVTARAFGVTSLVIRRFCKELHISFTHYKGKPPPQSEYLQHLSKLPFKGRKK